MVANLMFELPAVDLSTHTRSSGGLWLGEVGRGVRAGARDPRRRALGPRIGRGVRGRRLHRRRVLVHVVDELRQPGGDHRRGRSATRSPASRRVERSDVRRRCRSLGALAAVALELLPLPGRAARTTRRAPRTHGAARDRRETPVPVCCSSVCTTRGGRRWRSAGSAISPATGARVVRRLRTRGTRSTRRRSRRWRRSASTSAAQHPRALDRRRRSRSRRRRHDGLR